MQAIDIIRNSAWFVQDVTLHEIRIRKCHRIIEFYAFGNWIQMIQKGVAPFASAARILHVPVSREYAHPRQLYLSHLDYLVQLGHLLVRIEYARLTST